MKRFIGSIRRTDGNGRGDLNNGDSPEASVARGVRLFCESGGPNNAGEEVLHLPVIVEAAESSPAAAKEAAYRIRKFLVRDNYSRAYVQYNAIMLIRILSDNPGKSFTQNLDSKFVGQVKELFRSGSDPSVQQLLRETLTHFETEKQDDDNLNGLRELWKKEKTKPQRPLPTSQMRMAPSSNAPVGSPYAMIPPNQQYRPPQQNYFATSHRPRGLPAPHELSQRVEEAKTSAKLLLQVVQSTPPAEFMGNELIKEFQERCQSATRSVQGYIHSDNPPPDEDTLLTLIETNDQLSVALSKHQRALLQARRVTGVSPTPPAPSGTGPTAPPDMPPPTSNATNDINANTVAPPPGPPPQQQQQQPPQRGLFPRREPAAPQQQQPLPIPPPQAPSTPQPDPQDPFSDNNASADNVPQSFGLPPQRTMPRPAGPGHAIMHGASPPPG